VIDLHSLHPVVQFLPKAKRRATGFSPRTIADVVRHEKENMSLGMTMGATPANLRLKPSGHAWNRKPSTATCPFLIASLWRSG
jgi:hypothetical protein